MLNILILAGGGGRRLWPWSRERAPKQFLNLLYSRSMIQETIARVQDLTPLEHIFIATTRTLAPRIQEHLPMIPESHIIVEPEMRNTAPCIGLASLFIERSDPGGMMAVLPSDHIILDNTEFCKRLTLAARVAEEQGGIASLAVRPTRPETGYGYLELGQPLPNYEGVFGIKRFVEKPGADQAKTYVEQGNYLWNSGVFVTSITAIRDLIAQTMPMMHQGLSIIGSAIGSPEYEGVCQREYGKFDHISVDYGVLEHAPWVYAVPADMGWDDAGSWNAMGRLYPSDADGNVATGRIVAIESRNNIICNPNKLVAVLGVEDLIVVETEDCIMVATKEREQEIREIIKELENQGWKGYL